MSIKDILVFLDETAPSEGRLRLAANIAQEHHACLSAAFVQNGRHARTPQDLAAPWLGLLATPPFVGPINRTQNETLVEQSATLAEIAEQRFRDSVHSPKAKGDWYQVDRADVADLITLARTADLNIIGQTRSDARPAPAWRPEDIVVACGRPVLMVPYIGSYARVGRRVLIAWDGSREAVRALNDALPLIIAAEAVTVMTVRARAKDLHHDSLSMERIIRHLARHGIAAHTDEALQVGSAISDVLLSRSVDLSADLIVAGVYHHAQLRETLFGGVSRELFHHMTLPVLMSH